MASASITPSRYVAEPSLLKERYSVIAATLPAQQANYMSWLTSGAVDTPALEKAADKLGLILDVDAGQIRYAQGPEGARFGGNGKLCFDLLYVRHGKTAGNTEPRVFQGFVDEPINALNEIGLQQAEDAADKVWFCIFHKFKHLSAQNHSLIYRCCFLCSMLSSSVPRISSLRVYRISWRPLAWSLTWWCFLP
jgi:hypothetical protein